MGALTNGRGNSGNNYAPPDVRKGVLTAKPNDIHPFYNLQRLPLSLIRDFRQEELADCTVPAFTGGVSYSAAVGATT